MINCHVKFYQSIKGDEKRGKSVPSREIHYTYINLPRISIYNQKYSVLISNFTLLARMSKGKIFIT